MNCPTCTTPMQCPRCTRSAQVKAGLDRAAKQGKKGGRRSDFPPRIIAWVSTLRDEGNSFAEIARLTGVSKSTAHRLAGEGK